MAFDILFGVWPQKHLQILFCHDKHRTGDMKLVFMIVELLELEFRCDEGKFQALGRNSVKVSEVVLDSQLNVGCHSATKHRLADRNCALMDVIVVGILGLNKDGYG